MNPDGSVHGRFRATGVRPKLSERLAAYGIALPENLFDPDFGSDERPREEPR